ncbi:M1 family metallopeptidase [Geobacter sp. AOG2]|uniref:M1 family metallopeptidase n=1 Tax=Geobacter sp. AOG2 TaxID=1566347 RepID=UPI001CC67162|nr:M1 family aminopeptidase [Geobacter sp. AOG2]GFE59440.1 peptidase M1 [Geobacter sp. AOG2]
MMRYAGVRAAAAFAVFFLAGVAWADGTGPVVERQDIAVTLQPESHSLVGESTVTFAAGTGSVALRLSGTSRIESVTIAGSRSAFSFTGGILSLDLPAGEKALPVTVSYRATFNDQVSHAPAAGEDPSYGVNGAITREGTFLGGGAFWYPVPSQVPKHRSVSISAPAGIEAVTAGKRTLRETTGAVTRSRWEEARPIGVLTLCAGPYRVEQGSVEGIDIYTYFYRDNAPMAPRYLDAVARYLKFYRDLFGPYPFEKFAVVENFFPTGYGLPSFTLLGGSVIRLPFIIDTSLPHEIAHSWWGNGVDVDQREGNWCEGLVTYLADYLLKERRSAAEEYRRQLLIDYASLVTPASDFPLSAFASRSDPASRAIGYGKGAMVFHMVRSMIGDHAFFAALRQVCRDRLYRSASWSDLVRAFSKSAGRDLSAFMEQWLARPGGPRLSLAEVTTRRDAGGWTVSGMIVQTPPLFRLGVPLRLETAGARSGEVVPVLHERTRFTISSTDAPKRLLLDPEAGIFRILAPGEIPATVNSIKGSSQLIGVMTENCRARSETFKDFLASLSQGGARIINEAQLEEKEAARNDLVFCGVPRDRSRLPPLPEGIDSAATAFAVGGATYSANDGLLMLVMQRGSASGRVAALFQPLSETAAAQYAPKITHYGKYSYLVFADGANRRKGTTTAPFAGVAVDVRP